MPDARYMHGRDANMRQCGKILAVDALGGMSIFDVLDESSVNCCEFE